MDKIGKSVMLYYRVEQGREEQYRLKEYFLFDETYSQCSVEKTRLEIEYSELYYSSKK